MIKERFDVAILGAGPAGCSAALKLNERELSSVIIEKEDLPRMKICAGLAPAATLQVLEDYLNLEIPDGVLEKPSKVGLVYVPPSGLQKAGLTPNYELYNLNREKLDYWLASKVKARNIKILTKKHVKDIVSRNNQFIIKLSDNTAITSRFIIGCDGAKSQTRKILFNEKQVCAPIYQETYPLKEKYMDIIKPYFYIFLNGQVCNLYSYIIRKNRKAIFGTGNYDIGKGPAEAVKSMIKFKMILKKELPEISPLLEQEKPLRQLWFIPFSEPKVGKDNILLAGDAAGFVNGFSGEGIRMAVESGVYAAEAINENALTGKPAINNYQHYVKQLVDFCNITRKYASTMNDTKRENYLKETNTRRIQVK